MDKPLLSQQAGRVTDYLFVKKPSEYIPFKGEFPILSDWRESQFYEQVHAHMYLEECPEWMQTAVLRAEKIFTIEHGFVTYLSDNNILDKFKKMSAADKSTHLVAFLDKNCLGLDRLKI